MGIQALGDSAADLGGLVGEAYHQVVYFVFRQAVLVRLGDDATFGIEFEEGQAVVVDQLGDERELIARRPLELGEGGHGFLDV
ncbi:hypothetical protein D5273_00605 [Enterorhabdus caecimuris]|nr:hypothetical protein [Adlercreutzia caecimuris]